MAVGLLVAVGCGASNAAKPCTCNSATSVASATGGASAAAAPSTCVAGTAPGVRVGLQRATATFSQSYTGQFSVDKIIDGVTDDNLGWAVAAGDAYTVRAETAAVQTLLDTPTYPNGTRLGFVLVHNFSGGVHALGRFRISVTTSDRAKFADGNNGLVTTGNVGEESIWTVLKPAAACASYNLPISLLDDGSIRVIAHNFIPMSYTVIAETPLSKITGVRIEALKDRSLPVQGPGMQPVNGNFVLSEFQVYAGAR